MLVFEDGGYKLQRWYRFHPHPFSPPKSEDEAREELLEIYKRAIKRHLLSDVPLGLLLSGGIDSALLLALMNLYGNSWRTFTVGYGNVFADDELADAAQTASVFGGQHTEVLLDRQTFEESLPRVVEFMEEPVATPSVLPMFFVCERARQDVKVALIGQGPDELFGGYRRHVGIRYGQLWGGLPNWVRGPISSMVEALPRNETLKRGVRSLDTKDRLQTISTGSLASARRSGRWPIQCWRFATHSRGRDSAVLGGFLRSHDRHGRARRLSVRRVAFDAT